MVLLRSEIDTSLSAWSSLAEPANVIGLPGATVIGCTAVGGTITVGAEMDTVGGWPFSVTIQRRSEVSRSDWPAVSRARAWAHHSSSNGTVIS